MSLHNSTYIHTQKVELEHESAHETLAKKHAHLPLCHCFVFFSPERIVSGITLSDVFAAMKSSSQL